MSQLSATTGVRASDDARSRRSSRQPRPGAMFHRRARWGWAFVAPFVAMLTLFLVLPLIYAFILSLQNTTLVQGTTWVGLANYVKAFTDPLFLHGVWLVVRYSVILIPIQMCVSLIAALLLDSLSNNFARFARLMIFVPYAVPAVIGALMWGFLYSPNFGPAQEVFGWFGLHAPQLLAPQNIFASLVNIVTWGFGGYYMIIMYAALKGIDPGIYEAARIDGANGWQLAWRIKIPLISSALVLVLVFALIGTLQFFTEPQILRQMASEAIPPSYTPNMYAYTLAFSYSQFNYASTISFALGVIIFIGSYIFMYFTRRRSGLSS